MNRSSSSARRARLRPALERLEGRELMAVSGSLDPTFATGGVYTSPIDQAPSKYLEGVAVESDGSVVAAGEISPASTPTFGLLRLTSAGVPDPSFGTNGQVALAFPTGTTTADLPTVSLTSGGKILVGGTFTVGVGTSGTTDGIVARFNANGTLDSTYGTNGEVIVGPTGIPVDGVQFSIVSSSMAVQADGSVVVVGAVPLASSGSTTTQIGVTRLNPLGAVDSTFGTGGLVRITGNLQDATAVALTPASQIVVAGTVQVGPYPTNYEADIYRLNADGSLDTSLGETGIRAAGYSGIGQLLVQPDNKILAYGEFRVGGMGIPTSILVRLNADGSADATAPPDTVYTGGKLVLESDGKIVLASANLIRLTSGLAIDTTFGNRGVAIIAPSLASFFFAAAFDPNGLIVAVGATDDFATNLVARFTSTGTTLAGAPNDYNGDGISDPAVYLPATGTFAIGDSSGRTAGQLIQFGSPGAGASIPAPGDYYGTGRTDLAVYLVNQGAYAVQDPSGQSSGIFLSFGTPGAGQTIPAPGDYYNTGQADVAVYLAASGSFAIKDPTGNTPGAIIPFGMPGVGNSIPVPGDYDGSGHTELAVYVPSTATFYYRSNITGQDVAIPFGAPGLGVSLPMPGDYDGSGKTEVAVYVPSTGTFYYRPAAGGADVAILFGTPGLGQTIPDPGDYTGSGHTELGVYLTDTGTLAYRPAGGGNDVLLQFGTPGFGNSIPVTSTVLIPFPGSGSGSGDALGVASILGEPDTLDFLPTATSKKSKPGGPSAS